MVEADKKRFAAAMVALGVAFDTTPTSERMALYFEALREIRIEAVEWAAKEAIRSLKWFPKARELSELAEIAPRPKQSGLDHAQRPRLEELTPPDVAREHLREIAARLNGSFGTTFAVSDEMGRPEMVSEGR